ncbi:MAG TPA: PLP-dependent aminotransferase family protein [Casimicrobiaceae bacterium]
MPRSAASVAIPLVAGPVAAEGGLRDQIYKACLAAIDEGRLGRGARLPSARQLAADWRVARNTVDDALAQLQAEGFLARRVGVGTFVADPLPGPPGGRAGRRRKPAALGRRALARVSAWSRGIALTHAQGLAPRPTAFLAGLPALDRFPLDVWRRLAARRWRIDGAALLGYFPSFGHLPLREALLRHLAVARGIDAAVDQVMIVNSTMQAMELCARVLVDRGDVVWLEDPGYPNLHSTFAMAGARVAFVPVDGDGIDIDRGTRVAPAPALICVTPSCQYPTGARMSLARRLALLRCAERTGAWIVEDDYQSEFTYDGRPVTSLASLDRAERVIHVGTFTNSVFPSLRLAYAVLPRALVPVFDAVRRQLDDHTHGFMQAVLADFIDGGHFTAHLRAMRALYQQRRDILIDACVRQLPRGVALAPVVCGMNATMVLPRALRDTDAVARAAATGIRALPLSRHGHGATAHNGLLLGFTAIGERRIAAAVAALAATLRAVRHG